LEAFWSAHHSVLSLQDASRTGGFALWRPARTRPCEVYDLQVSNIPYVKGTIGISLSLSLIQCPADEWVQCSGNFTNPFLTGFSCIYLNFCNKNASLANPSACQPGRQTCLIRSFVLAGLRPCEVYDLQVSNIPYVKGTIGISLSPSLIQNAADEWVQCSGNFTNPFLTGFSCIYLNFCNKNASLANPSACQPGSQTCLIRSVNEMIILHKLLHWR
jgi:hypothetical protein